MADAIPEEQVESEGERLFRSLLESAPDAIVIVGPDARIRPAPHFTIRASR